MVEIKVTIKRVTRTYKCKTTKEDKSFSQLVLQLPNGKDLSISQNNFNIREVIYLEDVLDGRITVQ